MTGRDYQGKSMILMVTFFPLLISSVLSASASAPRADGIYFGEPLEGNRVIIPDGAMEPVNRNIPDNLYVITASGKKCPVEFLRKVTDVRTDRSMIKKSGPVFSYKEEPCGDFPIIMVSEDFLKQHVPVAVSQGTMKPLGKEEASRIEKARKAHVHKSWKIASLDDGTVFALVQFVITEKNHSSCLVLIAKDELVFEDYETIEIDDTKKKTGSGDDDIHTPDVVQIINVFRTAQGLEIVRRLEGHEGTNTDLMREDGSGFKVIRRNYFYWGPNL